MLKIYPKEQVVTDFMCYVIASIDIDCDCIQALIVVHDRILK